MRSQLSQIQQKVNGIKTSDWSKGFLGKGGEKEAGFPVSREEKLIRLIQIGHLMCKVKV